MAIGKQTNAGIRYSVEPGDVSPEKAARRLGLDLVQFETVLADLIGRGFPPADPTTGNYDLDAIDRWRAARWDRSGGLTSGNCAVNAQVVFANRVRALRHGRR